MAVSFTSQRQIEVYRFSLPVTVLVPFLAVFLQAFVPLRFPFFLRFDLPLLVVIFFAMARRSPMAGLLTGAAVGLLQDSLTGHDIGLNGIAKTVVGYGASSLGVKLDVENAGTRLLITVAFYIINKVLYFTVARGLLSQDVHWSWPHELINAVVNGLLGVFLFAAMDKLKQRA